MGGYTSSKTTGSVYPGLNCALYGKLSANIISRYRDLCMNKFLVQTRLKTRTATRVFLYFVFCTQFWEGSGLLRNPGGEQHENNRVQGREVCIVAASESKVRMS